MIWIRIYILSLCWTAHLKPLKREQEPAKREENRRVGGLNSPSCRAECKVASTIEVEGLEVFLGVGSSGRDMPQAAEGIVMM